ncbi:hypothetical protein GDO78_012739 [Eleutherodactylus coqui]|uniref:Uncharacterized protein n=1 Tax=Eleutherodactylus coqui TaxID=57060 RepID=A0A8J6F1S2_ELECQ|nr:hypothetical protein GDO78_012739 [Eleutherodactylus coqui]
MAHNCKFGTCFSDPKLTVHGRMRTCVGAVPPCHMRNANFKKWDRVSRHMILKQMLSHRSENHNSVHSLQQYADLSRICRVLDRTLTRPMLNTMGSYSKCYKTGTCFINFI